MKTTRIFTYLLLCLQLLLVGCSESDPDNTPAPLPEPDIQISANALTFEAEGGSKDITVTASGKWAAAVDQEAWCQVTANGSKASINVKKNETDDERNTKVEFTCGNKKATLTVTQKAQKTLLLTSSKVDVSAKEQNIKVVVKSNVNYTTKIDEDASAWISVVESRAATEKTHSFKIAENKTTVKREGKILFTGEGLTETLYVYQKGGEEPQLVLTQNEYVVSEDKNEIKIELKSNTDYQMILPEVDWIHKDQSRALSTYTHYLTIDENTTSERRSALIRFVYGDKTEEVTVIQRGKNPIDMEKDTYEFEAGGGLLNVKVASGANFEVEKPDWIKQEKGNGTDEDVVTFVVEKNPTPMVRKGEIKFKTTDKEQTITVVQQGLSQLHLYTVADASFVVIPSFTTSSTLIGKVIWGDGSSEAFKPKAEHTYKQPNSYDITIELETAQSFYLDKLTGLSGISIANF